MYLKTSRGSKGQPFRFRKDFSKFKEDPKYRLIQRITNVFKKFPHVGMDDYFNAPFKVYSNDEDAIYDLNFYASLKAIACYKKYMKIREMESPDSEDQLNFITDSFRFILKFCISNKITFDEYLDYKLGFTYEWMKHYNDRIISIYSLLDMPNIYDRIVSMEDEHRKLLLGDLDQRFFSIKTRYDRSDKAKNLVSRGTMLLKNKTDKNRQENNEIGE